MKIVSTQKFLVPFDAGGQLFQWHLLALRFHERIENPHALGYSDDDDAIVLPKSS